MTVARIALAASLVIVGLSTQLAACGSGDDAPPEEPLILRLGGMQVTLDVPDGALPDGVERAEISIERAGELFGEAGDEGELLALRLDPDGAQFRIPVTLTITLEPPYTGEAVTLPRVLHVSGEREASRIEILNLLAWKVAGRIGVDRWLLPAPGTTVVARAGRPPSLPAGSRQISMSGADRRLGALPVPAEDCVGIAV